MALLKGLKNQVDEQMLSDLSLELKNKDGKIHALTAVLHYKYMGAAKTATFDSSADKILTFIQEKGYEIVDVKFDTQTFDANPLHARMRLLVLYR